MTTSDLVFPRMGVLLSGLLIAAAALAGCSSNSPKQEMGGPATTTVNPMGGQNSFAPTITAPAAPNAVPGNH